MRHTYYVSDAFNNPIDRRIQFFYEDSFVVGEFENDEEAWEATIAIQEKHDAEAMDEIERCGYPEDVYDTAPSYTNHLFREASEGEPWYEPVQVML